MDLPWRRTHVGNVKIRACIHRARVAAVSLMTFAQIFRAFGVFIDLLTRVEPSLAVSHGTKGTRVQQSSSSLVPTSFNLCKGDPVWSFNLHRLVRLSGRLDWPQLTLQPVSVCRQARPEAGLDLKWSPNTSTFNAVPLTAWLLLLAFFAMVNLSFSCRGSSGSLRLNQTCINWTFPKAQEGDPLSNQEEMFMENGENQETVDIFQNTPQRKDLESVVRGWLCGTRSCLLDKFKGFEKNAGWNDQNFICENVQLREICWRMFAESRDNFPRINHLWVVFFNNSAVTEHVLVRAHTVVDGFAPSKNGCCSITQLLSQPKARKVFCDFTGSSARTMSSWTLHLPQSLSFTQRRVSCAYENAWRSADCSNEVNKQISVTESVSVSEVITKLNLLFCVKTLSTGQIADHAALVLWSIIAEMRGGKVVAAWTRLTKRTQTSFDKAGATFHNPKSIHLVVLQENISPMKPESKIAEIVVRKLLSIWVNSWVSEAATVLTAEATQGNSKYFEALRSTLKHFLVFTLLNIHIHEVDRNGKKFLYWLGSLSPTWPIDAVAHQDPWVQHEVVVQWGGLVVLRIHNHPPP